MKNIGYILLIFTCTLIVFSACDSATDSKPVSVTPPTLVSPHDTASNQPLTPTFEWTGSAGKLEIDGNNNTFANIVHSADVTGNSYTYPTNATYHLVANHTYYWRAGNTASGTTYWSANVFAFTTAP